MDPVSLGLQAVGLGLQLYSGISASGKAKEAAQLNKEIAGEEMQINNQKRTQMELQARRMTMEVFRNAQRLRAQATAAGVNQGASKGSGLQGGLAQIGDEAATNLTSLQQNLTIGRNIFDLNDRISSAKMKLADVQSDMYADQALGSLGGALIKTGPTIGGLVKDLGGSKGGSDAMGSPV